MSCLLSLSAVQHDIEVAQVLFKLYFAILVLVHDREHAVAQKAQRVYCENTKGLFVGRVVHLSSYRVLRKPTEDLLE